MYSTRSSTLTVGGDPELFLYNAKAQVVAPVIGLVGGTKGAPIPLKHGAVQEDNVMLELNIIPSATAHDFVLNTTLLLREVEALLRPKGYTLHVASAAKFTPHDLRSRQAKTFGCSPDYNAYTKGVNPRVKLPDPLMRYAGGHLHVGLTGGMSDELRINVVKWLDFCIGLLLPELDSSGERTLVYGKAGNYRPTSYGVEYRTPSNFWLTSTTLTKQMFNLTHAAVQRALTHEFTFEVCDPELMVHAINTNDRKLAKYLRAMSSFSRGLPR